MASSSANISSHTRSVSEFADDVGSFHQHFIACDLHMLKCVAGKRALHHFVADENSTE